MAPYFEIGIVLGIVFILVLEHYLFKYIGQLRDGPPGPNPTKLPVHTQQPPDFHQKVKELYEAGPQINAEVCTWLNTIIDTVVWEFKGKENIEESVRSSLSFSTDQLKEKNITWVNYVKVLGFDMGHTLPFIEQVQLIPPATMDRQDGLRIQAHLVFDGNIRLAVEAQLELGPLQPVLQLTITLMGINGVLLLDYQEGIIDISFREEPRLIVDIKFKAGSVGSVKISQLIKRKIQDEIRERMVYPNTINIPLKKNLDLPTHRLFVRVVRCSGLISRQKVKPLPAVVVTLDSHQQQSKARSRDRTTNPQINELFDFDIGEGDASSICIEVFDDSTTVVKDKSLGYVNIPVESIGSRPAQLQYPLITRDLTLPVTGHVVAEIWKVNLAQLAKEEAKKARKAGASRADDAIDPKASKETLQQQLLDTRKQMDEIKLALKESPEMADPKALQLQKQNLRDLRIQERTVVERLRSMGVSREDIAILKAEALGVGENATAEDITKALEQEADIELLGADDHVSIVDDTPSDTARNPVNPSFVHTGIPHELKVHTYRVPTNCDQCGQLLWGVVRQGMKCHNCRFNCHYKCAKQVGLHCQPGELNSSSLGLSDSRSHTIMSRRM